MQRMLQGVDVSLESTPSPSVIPRAQHSMTLAEAGTALAILDFDMGMDHPLPWQAACHQVVSDPPSHPPM